MARARDFLDSYRLVRLIRAGQACQVWEAVNDEDGKRYALKVLQAEFVKDREQIRTLRREFDVAHDFKHPNVIRIYGFEEKGPVPYVVMELFNENNLKQALREGPDPLAPVAGKIVEQSAEGLYYLHKRGWVHCDVKPDNFLVDDDGFVKLIDFAISRRLKQGGLSRLFFKPKIQGTRSYMSPEQIRGHSLDPRADIYSFGCVLFELVAGKPPFTGESPTDLLNKHLRASIPSTLVANDNVSPEFNALVRKMLSKKPEQRPASMWDFLKQFRMLPGVYRTLPKKAES